MIFFTPFLRVFTPFLRVFTPFHFREISQKNAKRQIQRGSNIPNDKYAYSNAPKDFQAHFVDAAGSWESEFATFAANLFVEQLVLITHVGTAQSVTQVCIHILLPLGDFQAPLPTRIPHTLVELRFWPCPRRTWYRPQEVQ